MRLFVSDVLAFVHGSFVCEYNGERRTFKSAEDYCVGDWGEGKVVSGISIDDGYIFLSLEDALQSLTNNDAWIKNYVAKNGREPSQFD